MGMAFAVHGTMTDHDTDLLSIAAAAAAGALFMYWLDAYRSRRRESQPEQGGEEHRTTPARAAWNEQGV
jgi:zinc transporter ZupT